MNAPRRLVQYLEKQPDWRVLLFALLLTAVLGVLDYVTGFELAFSTFYLLPISLTAWHVGRRTGLAFSGLSAVSWLLADLGAGHTYSNPLIPYWNALMRFGFFITVTLLLVTLRGTLREEHHLARTDYLTGVANGRSFTERISLEIARATRSRAPLTLAYVDLDNFKAVNDDHGHAAGDDLLRGVAAGVCRTLRATDLVGRLGGDEFAVLLPETTKEQALAVMRRVRTHLLAVLAKDGSGVTLSIGVVTFRTPELSADEMIGLADKTMYAVKTAGKNGIEHVVV